MELTPDVLSSLVVQFPLVVILLLVGFRMNNDMKEIIKKQNEIIDEQRQRQHEIMLRVLDRALQLSPTSQLYHAATMEAVRQQVSTQK